MANQKKLNRWAEKLLDTGKRNNLINFKDSKSSTAEVIYPDCEKLFSRCSVGTTFEIYDPKIPDDDMNDEGDESAPELDSNPNKKLSKAEFKATYSSRIKSNRYILVYAQTPNPLTAIKNIAKKAQKIQDETGIDVAYLAFGFLRWNEKAGSDSYYRAPLLLVHINIITGSVIDPVKIEINDDDVVVNPTFDYLLQTEYGLSLPSFEDGESLTSYYQKVMAIVKRLGWSVIDECRLSVFSFLKIMMYEDLKKNARAILGNENIKALLGEETSDGLSFSSVEHVVDNPLIDLHTVIDADSSQIEAVEMAKSGKSFVLQGPPGTGKSQTITNIIAECLYDRKKVLFVSEKQAALNVVFDKLKKAGLSDFCLELHSHKANKKAVIEELNRTLEIPKSRVSSRAQDEVRQKLAAQLKLDEYADELHKKRDVINLSLYQLFEKYSAERNYPDLPIDIRLLQTKGSDYLLSAVHLLEQYVEYIPSIGLNYRKNAWYGFNRPQISFDERNQFEQDLSLVLQGFKELQQTTLQIKNRYEAADLNYAQTLKWQEVLSFSASSDVVTPMMLSRNGYDYALPYINQLRELSNSIIPLKKSLLVKFSSNVLRDLDGQDLYTKLSGQFSGMFSRWFSGEYKNLIANIQLYVKDGEKIKYQSALDFSQKLIELQTLMTEFSEKEANIRGYIGACYDGPDTDWNHVMSSLQTVQSFFDNETLSYGSLSSMDASHFVESQTLFQTDAAKLSDEIQTVTEAKKRIQNYFDSNTLDLENDNYNFCIRKLQKCFNDVTKLGNWISFMDLLDQLANTDLSSYIDLIIRKKITPENIVGTYRKAFYRHWIENITFNVPALSSFSRIKQDQAVQTFSVKDNLQYEINKSEIKSELSQQRPNLDLVAGGSAVALLRREGMKKRKQLPIRKLLSDAGDLVQILKPCFMMSPLSVSTFLEPDKISFDTVVFDEASQIFPQDAIGAIYRGKQLIVVGDSKQMPPSNFFSATIDNDDDNDDDIGDITDFESILDICSSVFSTERLAWHYRSHYEQLIAFSNNNFYNNKLVTFPSSATDHKWAGVDYYYVDGIFDRKSKTNRAEAEFIVDLVYKNIEKYPNRSLGIVAFSVAQQTLIDRLLSKRRESDPSFEWFFSADNPEPFFVKNLETVQGDERDTIIFSVAYAKDSQGRFINNFGPLNREGGERRLNVAVTRAKDNVQLVASIHYTDITIGDTGSEGARLLRAYLDYAQNGEKALEREISVSADDHFDSYFEQEVCDYLRDQGFTVDTQVGCSGYRIDLGLRKPGSSKYLLAIECDGATYHSSKNARDRDSLRQRILENMGWQFYRIWSTDWYKNTAVEKERLLNAVKEAEKKEASSELSVPSEKEVHSEDDPLKNESLQFEMEVPDSSLGFEEYRPVNAMKILNHPWTNFQKGILKILEVEAPLSEEYLLKRITGYFGREKVTKVVISSYNSKMYRCINNGIKRKNGFLYLEGKSDYKLRIPGERRDIKYISREELADGLYTLIGQNVTTTKDGLYKTMTNILGFNRTTETIISQYDAALSLLKKSKKVVESDGLLMLA